MKYKVEWVSERKAWIVLNEDGNGDISVRVNDAHDDTEMRHKEQIARIIAKQLENFVL